MDESRVGKNPGLILDESWIIQDSQTKLKKAGHSEGALIVRPPVGGLDADYMGGGQYGPLRKIP